MHEEMQIRTRSVQFRAEETDAGKRVIEGYFSVFGDVYPIWDGEEETIDPHAFDDALEDDIRALIDHDTRLVLGRTQAGTLRLRVDEHGLWGEIDVNPDDMDAMNLYARIKRGDVSNCSFGFDILEEDFEQRDNAVRWTIRKVKLYEVSCVTFPAYKQTEVTARAEKRRENKKRQVEAWRARMKGRIEKWH